MLLVDLATTEPMFMVLLATVGKLWDSKHQQMGQNVYANMEDFTEPVTYYIPSQCKSVNERYLPSEFLC